MIRPRQRRFSGLFFRWRRFSGEIRVWKEMPAYGKTAKHDDLYLPP